MTDFQKATDAAMATLAMIEQSVAKSSGEYDSLRKRADDVYEERVLQLATQNDVDMFKAHSLAVTDEIAIRAYAVSQELAERQSAAQDASDYAPRYIG